MSRILAICLGLGVALLVVPLALDAHPLHADGLAETGTTPTRLSVWLPAVLRGQQQGGVASAPQNGSTPTATATATPTTPAAVTRVATTSPASPTTQWPVGATTPTATTSAPPAVPTWSPTPSFTPTATVTPTMADSAGLLVEINANLFPALDPTKLRAGDIFKGQAVRYGTPGTPLARATFLSTGVDRLNAISADDARRYGLQKMLAFSALADLQTYIDDPAMPADVGMIDYDFEGVMTPATELADPVGSVQAFAAIVHSRGKKMAFTPIAATYAHLETTGQLASILQVVDFVEYQGQNQLPTLGETAFLAEVADNAAYVHDHGAAQSTTQLWLGTQTCDEMVQIFNAARGTIDVAAIGSHDDGTSAACVLNSLQR